MPLKSWAFQFGDHSIRAEVWWRFSGWYRKRLFVDHKRLAAKRGRFGISRPLTAHVDAVGPVEVRFRFRRFAFDMDCEVKIDDRFLSWDQFHPAIEKLRTYSIEEEGIETHEGASLGCFIAFPLLIGLWALSIPLLLIGALWLAAGFQRRRDRKFENRMRASGRFLEWGEVENRLKDAPSTLIIQTVNGAPMRCWWTQDDIRASSPLDLPPIHEACSPGGHGSNGPFVAWSYAIYLSESSGKALLTKPSEKFLEQIDLLENDEEVQAMISGEFPNLKLVAVHYPSKKAIRVADSFAQVVGSDLNAAVPGLIHALESEDRFLRRLALKALQEAGPAIGPFVPALEKQFYFGPWEDEDGVMEALTAAGPAGLDFLTQASQWEDAVFRHRAQIALNRHAHYLEHPRTNRIVRVSRQPKETPAKSPGRIRLRVVMAIAYWLVMLGVCVGCFMRFGIALGIAAMFGVLVLAVLITIIPYVIYSLWRVRKLSRKQMASLGDGAGRQKK